MNSTGNDIADRASAAARNASPNAHRTAADAGVAMHNEFDALVADAEDLVNHTADTMGSQTASARAKLQSTLAKAKAQIASGADAIGKQTRLTASAADDYDSDRPWPAIGVAAITGLAIGVLLGRR